MAEEAHKEPTMEEILASIRKIISEDDDGKGGPPATNELRADDIRTEDAGADDEGLSLEALASETRADDDMFEEFDLSDLADEAPAGDVEDEPVAIEPLVHEAAPDAPFEEDSVERLQDDFEAVEVTAEHDDDELVLEPFEQEPPIADEPGVAVATPDPTPPQAPQDIPAEQTMQALTEESTDAAAAGALAKLVAKMDMGSENTLEGLVRELIKPMIKEWLDANLPAIVEDKVEAEVQRIARLAR